MEGWQKRTSNACKSAPIDKIHLICYNEKSKMEDAHMPRQAREKCESTIYHVMLRGVNRQQIFEDEEDCEKFLWGL